MQFADGVYEVCEVRAGRIVDERRHMARLARSLQELRIAAPMTPAALAIVMRETVARNRVRDGIVYVQITRGAAKRDFPFPPAATKPTVIVTARSNDIAKLEQLAAEGVAVVTMPDIRWGRVDIKSVGLLPNVLAKQAAREQGAREAWLVDGEGRVTEGASSSAWIVDKEGTLHHPSARARYPARRHPRGGDRGRSRRKGLAFEERAFTVAEAYGAREAFITSASQIVLPVTSIDGRPIGNGAPGLIATGLRRDYHRHAEST